MSTPADVAAWMAEEVRTKGELYQEDAVGVIESRFGSEYVYDNENGNLAISKAVLAEFRRITKGDVVWVRSERYWRKRETGDEPGRQQE